MSSSASRPTNSPLGVKAIVQREKQRVLVLDEQYRKTAEDLDAQCKALCGNDMSVVSETGASMLGGECSFFMHKENTSVNNIILPASSTTAAATAEDDSFAGNDNLNWAEPPAGTYFAVHHHGTSCSSNGEECNEDSDGRGFLTRWAPRHLFLQHASTTSLHDQGDEEQCQKTTPSFIADEYADAEDYEVQLAKSKANMVGFNLSILFPKNRNSSREDLSQTLRPGEFFAGRYEILGVQSEQGNFSTVFKAWDTTDSEYVCLKIAKNDPETGAGLVESFEEIRILRVLNESGQDSSEHGIVKYKSSFFYRNHVCIVCELLKDNMYEHLVYTLSKEREDESLKPFYDEDNLKQISIQILTALQYIHRLDCIHLDLKPENILYKEFDPPSIRIVDFGAAQFVQDPEKPSYIQSRTYRAPEVVLNLDYDGRADVWSFGAILYEIACGDGQVLFPCNDNVELLARISSICGPIPTWMVKQGRDANKYFAGPYLFREMRAEEAQQSQDMAVVLYPQQSSIAEQLGEGHWGNNNTSGIESDSSLLAFLEYVLQVDCNKRPTAKQALQHPWLASVTQRKSVLNQPRSPSSSSSVSTVGVM